MSDGVKCTQSWLCDDDFWFCHWEADHEDLIHQKLTEVGADGLFFTMLQEMKFYSNSSMGDQKMYLGV